ncbi:MAG: L-serine ammonia-lyase, iron-sulfur-dependent, subunit alpha [Desulfobacteraceae bacterium]
MNYSVKDILKFEVSPALGCTEPTAVALGAAAAVSLLEKQKKPDHIEIRLDPNIFKNGLAVAIPGTEGKSGLDMAAALGAAAGKPELKMEVLADITERDVEKASDMLSAGKVTVHLLYDKKGLYINTRVTSGGDIAESTIESQHDNITHLALNGKIPGNAHVDFGGEKSGEEGGYREFEQFLKNLSVRQAAAMVDTFDIEDLAFIKKGIQMNMDLAAYGLSHNCGLKVGKTFEKLVRKGFIKADVIHKARVLTSAASDARMSGASLPAMSSAGSGNHGLTAIIPVKVIADHIKSDEKDLCRAVGLSHIITACVKSHTGRLAAICACSVASGAGAAAGAAWLLGASVEKIGNAVENIIEDLAGVICDGAKNSCALKLATASGNSLQAALFAVYDLNVKMTDGIVGETPEKTIRNIGVLSSEGMIETDRTILKIMLEKILSGDGRSCPDAAQ